MYRLVANSRVAIDDQWYGRLSSLLAEFGETFELLLPPPASLQRSFDQFIISGQRVLSDLYPEGLDENKMRNIKQRLQELAADIIARESNASVRQLYLEKIDEFIANIGIVQAAARHDPAAYQQANVQIYGRPDESIFRAACSWIREDVTRFKKEQPTCAPLCDDIFGRLPDVHGDSSLLFPSDATFKTVRELHFTKPGYIEQLFGDLPTEGAMITRPTGDVLVRRVISNLGSDYTIADSSNGLWAVAHSRREVLRPRQYSLSREAFLGIVAHEVGSHMLEAINGERSGLSLLSLGLAGYERGNEGRAIVREQIMYKNMAEYVAQPGWFPTKASWEYRLAIYIVICLASWVHGKIYSFSELFALLQSLFRYWMVQHSQSSAQIDEDVINKGCWNMLTRALKGTDGHGGAYYKDIVYVEGNVRCWQVASIDPQLMMFGDLGKFDITNNKHVIMLREAGIVPYT